MQQYHELVKSAIDLLNLSYIEVVLNLMVNFVHLDSGYDIIVGVSEFFACTIRCMRIVKILGFGTGLSNGY
mgnify:CR=1 FL=1